MILSKVKKYQHTSFTWSYHSQYGIESIPNSANQKRFAMHLLNEMIHIYFTYSKMNAYFDVCAIILSWNQISGYLDVQLFKQLRS